MNESQAVTLCKETKLFVGGDLVQVRSQTGRHFPVFTVGELEHSQRDNVIVVKVWYYNSHDGDLKVALGPQTVFVKVKLNNGEVEVVA